MEAIGTFSELLKESSFDFGSLLLNMERQKSNQFETQKSEISNKSFFDHQFSKLSETETTNDILDAVSSQILTEVCLLVQN